VHMQGFMHDAGMTENGSCWHDGLMLTSDSLEENN